MLSSSDALQLHMTKQAINARLLEWVERAPIAEESDRKAWSQMMMERLEEACIKYIEGFDHLRIKTDEDQTSIRAFGRYNTTETGVHIHCHLNRDIPMVFVDVLDMLFVDSPMAWLEGQA